MTTYRFARIISLIIVFSVIACRITAQIPAGPSLPCQPGKFDHLQHLIEQKWSRAILTGDRLQRNDDLYTLPVVFHIIHTNGAENIPDADVMEAFRILNDAFANRNEFDQGSGVDTRIQFCLAQKDPDGNHTTGITRTYADLPKVNPAIHQQLLESLIKWDPDRYINIWVVKEVDLEVEFKRCGYTDFNASGYGGGGLVVAEASSLSAIIVHEMGHALGLLHTFNGWCVNNNCLTDGDGICDTPPEETITIQGGCTDPENSCHTDTQSGFNTDQNDLKTNHMDYGNGACRHDFTQGQKEKMRFVILNNHPGWLASDVCNNDCSNPAEAEFTFAALPEYQIGNTVQFTNISSNAVSYEWRVNNNLISTNTHLSYTFPGQGWYKTELLAKPSPDEVKCRNKQINWIRVYCNIKAEVTANKKKAIVNEVVHFSSSITQITGGGPVLYEWYANNILFGNGPEVDFSFTTPGYKIFYLVTIQGTCRDTSLPDGIDIKPLPDYTIDLGFPVCLQNKPEKISFSICNDGFAVMPAGIPVTFYSSNPQTGPATIVGQVFYTNEEIDKFCCKDFEFTLPANYTGAWLFAVINDDHSIATPYNLATDFPVTSFPESVYINNLDSIDMQKFAVVAIPPEATAVIGSSVQLSVTANQPSSFTWQSTGGTFSCRDCSNTSFTPLRYTRVIVEGVSEGQCKAYDTVIVKIIADGDVYIPSAFTPNNDDLNDYFYVLAGSHITNIASMQVYDRWGQQVFSRQNITPNIPQSGWDGKVKGQKNGSAVYVYLIRVMTNSHTVKEYKGTVTVIR